MKFFFSVPKKRTLTLTYFRPFILQKKQRPHLTSTPVFLKFISSLDKEFWGKR